MGNITFVFLLTFYDFVSRETMERCSALYAEVQRSVGRLARVCERRKAQLEKHLPSPPPASNKEDCNDVDDARIDNGNSVSACRQVGNRKTHFHLRQGDFIDLEKKKWDAGFFFGSGTYESRKTPHRDPEG